MLTKTAMQEIQDLKMRGYTQTEIIQYYKEKGEKPPSRPTIQKYYQMDVIPANPGAALVKEKAFDQEPFRSAILIILNANAQKDYCMSSVYDVLEEMFVESGEFDSLPGNEQTLRNYIHYLEESGQITKDGTYRRIYDHVFDTPPGQQMLVDFGEVTLAKDNAIHFICLLLRYSRMLYVYAQNHKFNATEACQAMYKAFCKMGGRPAELVIDQDAVFITDETYGEIVKTQVFEDFCTEQDLKLWVCHKADPESKGPVENTVGFVKKNFFSAREITCIDDVWRSLPGWLERKSKRIHKATYCVPASVFQDTEQAALRPLLPSVFEVSPNSFSDYEIEGQPFILYKSSRYSVPKEYAYSTVKYRVVGVKIHIYDKDRNFICSHYLNERKGSFNQLPEHKIDKGGDWYNVMEKMRSKWNCYDFQHFVNGVKKENPRYIAEQLRAIDAFLDKEAPSKTLVAEVMKACCEQYRYSYKQFLVVYQMKKAGISTHLLPSKAVTTTPVEYKELADYAEAYRQRIVKAEVTQL